MEALRSSRVLGQTAFPRPFVALTGVGLVSIALGLFARFNACCSNVATPPGSTARSCGDGQRGHCHSVYFDSSGSTLMPSTPPLWLGMLLVWFIFGLCSALVLTLSDRFLGRTAPKSRSRRGFCRSVCFLPRPLAPDLSPSGPDWICLLNWRCDDRFGYSGACRHHYGLVRLAKWRP